MTLSGGFMFSSIAYAMGTPSGGAEGGANAMLANFAPIILIIIIFYFMLIRPQQKRAKQHKEMLNNMKKGDPVITSSGIYGRIIELDGEDALVDLGDVKVYMARSNLNTLASSQKCPVPLKKSKKKSAPVIVEEDEDDDSSN
jgi:preprotein translocase subunit YajC